MIHGWFAQTQEQPRFLCLFFERREKIRKEDWTRENVVSPCGSGDLEQRSTPYLIITPTAHDEARPMIRLVVVE